MLLWEEYKRDNPNGLMYTQFCERYRNFKKSNQITMHIEHKAGEEMQVDWAGTKTETSDRTIKLPLQAFEMLKEYRKVQKEDQLRAGDQWVEIDRIFTQWNGEPIHPDSITGWFREFIQKTDLPQISIHSLRHTNITLLIAAGVPLRTVSYRAGHAQTLQPQTSTPMR